MRIDGSTGVKPLVEALAAAFQEFEGSHEITFSFGEGLKPADRISALAKGSIDIAIASHGIDIEQIHSLGLTTHRFAKMAVVFGVNHSVPINHLTHQQICDIYSENILDWHFALRNSNNKLPPKINAYTRPFDEVDAEVVIAQIPCFKALTIPNSIKVMPTSGDMARALATTLGAIGMTTQVRVVQSDGQIRPIAINGVFPSIDNMLTNKYPLSRDSFLITTGSPSQNVTRFIEFIYSKQGAEVIMDNNSVPVN